MQEILYSNMKNPVTKAVLKDIKNLAKRLPPVALEGKVELYRSMVGQGFINNGVSKDKDNGVIDPRSNYISKLDIKPGINHERRLRKAYEDQGWLGVDLYLKGLQRIQIAQNKENTPDAVTKDTSNDPK